MKTRKNFPVLLDMLNLQGLWAEVGVYKGDFSHHLLAYSRCKKLYSIDPYKCQGRLLDASDVSQREHDAALKEADEKLHIFGERSKLCRLPSVDAAAVFADGELDFVYLDACHDYRSIWEDLKAWHPKVRIGGVIAGHDYKDSFVRKNLVEVKRAVDNFFRMKQENILTTTEDNIPSWYVIREKANTSEFP